MWDVHDTWMTLYPVRGAVAVSHWCCGCWGWTELQGRKDGYTYKWYCNACWQCWDAETKLRIAAATAVPGPDMDPDL